MKYTLELEVAVSQNDFVKKMDNADNMKHWQKGLVSYEHISGTPGMVGAKMKLNYQFGKRNMELTETIVETNFPDSFHATYDTKGMRNIQKNFFYKTSQNRTKWVSECEFIPTNFLMRLMTTFMKSSFKKQSLSYMQDFKNFAENGTSVADK